MKYLLIPFSWLFLLITTIRNFLYNTGVFEQKTVAVPVLCVGNITTGGTGKTPWVQMISQHFKDLNKNVAIISRGYTGDFSGVVKVTDTMDPRRCGDEPLWLKRNTQSQVYIGRDRYVVANQAMNEDSYDLLLLDDGFQHRQFYRDFNLVLLDASVDPSQYKMLPYGRLRESFSGLKRADAIIINKCNYANEKQVDHLYGLAAQYVGEARVFRADFEFERWQPLVAELGQQIAHDNVSLSCGVGNPSSFVKTVKAQGITPVKSFIYPDHHFWNPNDVELMAYQMKQINSHHLVITEKDAVKLARYKRHFFEMGIQVWVCKMNIQFKENEAEFFKLLQTFLAIKK